MTADVAFQIQYTGVDCITNSFMQIYVCLCFALQAVQGNPCQKSKDTLKVQGTHEVPVRGESKLFLALAA